MGSDQGSQSDSQLQTALSEMRNIIAEAEGRNIPEPTSVSLATADSEGRPSVRTIYLHTISDKGPVFFINLDSGKGKQIVANPCVALCMYVQELQQQITLEGEVEALPEQESDELWHLRSRSSQLASWVSDQGPSKEGKEQLLEKRDSFKNEYDFEPVPRPANWKAMLIHPSRMEFWDTGWHRLRQRRLYTRQDNGKWSVDIENP